MASRITSGARLCVRAGVEKIVCNLTRSRHHDAVSTSLRSAVIASASSDRTLQCYQVSYLSVIFPMHDIGVLIRLQGPRYPSKVFSMTFRGHLKKLFFWQNSHFLCSWCWPSVNRPKLHLPVT